MPVYILIQNFKCYKFPPTKFKFDSECLSLIEGVSGKGKSTILLSILWCLYGGLKGTIKPLKDSNANIDHISANDVIPGVANSATAVMIIFESLKRFKSERVTIKRMSSATSSLEVKVGNSVLDPSSSESWIHREFGSSILWTACSFVRQGERNSLLNLANSERYCILNELTFGNSYEDGVDIEGYISKSSELVKAKKVQFLRDSANVASLRDSYDTITQTVKLTPNNFIDYINSNGLPKNLIITSKLDSTLIKFNEYIITDYKKVLANDQALSDKIKNKISDYNTKLTSVNSIIEHSKEKISDVKSILDIFDESEYSKLASDIIPSEDSMTNNVKYFVNLFMDTGGEDDIFKSFDVFNRHDAILDRFDSIEELKSFNKNLKSCFNVYSKVKSCFNSNGVNVYGEDIYTLCKIKNLQSTVKKYIYNIITPELNSIEVKSKTLYTSLKSYYDIIKTFINHDLLGYIPSAPISISTFKEWADFVENHKSYIHNITSIRDKINNDATTLLKITNEFKNSDGEECLIDCPSCKIKINIIDTIKSKFGVLKSDEPDVLMIRVGNINRYLSICNNIEYLVKDYYKYYNLIDSTTDSCDESVDILESILQFEKPSSYITNLNLVQKSLSKIQLTDLIVPFDMIDLYLDVKNRIKTYKKHYKIINTNINDSVTINDIKEINKYIDDIINGKNEIDKRRYRIQTQLDELIVKYDTSKKLSDTINSEFKQFIIANSALILAKYNIEPEKTQYDYDTYVKLDNELSFKKASIYEFEKMMERYNTINLAINKINTALEREKSSKETYENAIKAHNILQIVSREAVKHTTDNISKMTNTVLERLFDQDFFGGPMQIQLELGVSGSKTSSNTYNTVSLYVLHRGTRYEGYKLLSGGEADRLSIAITIALSILSTSPFLFFDEAMASLDENLRERCYNVMKEFAKSKTIINICHSSVEGFHDEVINL